MGPLEPRRNRSDHTVRDGGPSPIDERSVSAAEPSAIPLASGTECDSDSEQRQTYRQERPGVPLLHAMGVLTQRLAERAGAVPIEPCDVERSDGRTRERAEMAFDPGGGRQASRDDQDGRASEKEDADGQQADDAEGYQSPGDSPPQIRPGRRTTPTLGLTRCRCRSARV